MAGPVGARARQCPGVEGVAPFVDVQAMLGRAGTLQPVLLHGIDPAVEAGVSSIEQHLLQGRLSDLAPGARGMVIGRVLAWQIGAEVGDELTVMVPGPRHAGGRRAAAAADVHGHRHLRGRAAGPRRLARAVSHWPTRPTSSGASAAATRPDCASASTT